MKVVLTFLILTATTITFASGGAKTSKKKERFEKRKARATEMADKRIQSLQSLKGCISQASKKSELKGCQETHRKKTMEFVKARKAERAKMKAERIKRKSEKKK